MQQIWRYVQTILGLIFRHPIAGACVIPVLPNGQLVLVKRQDNGLWGLPGGIIDWGEDVTTTIRRELAEETGLELVSIRRLVGVYSSPDRDPRIHSVCITVEAEVQGTMQILDQLEISEVQAFSRDALPPEPLTHDHYRQLQDYFNGTTTLA